MSPERKKLVLFFIEGKTLKPIFSEFIRLNLIRESTTGKEIKKSKGMSVLALLGKIISSQNPFQANWHFSLDHPIYNFV